MQAAAAGSNSHHGKVQAELAEPRYRLLVVEDDAAEAELIALSLARSSPGCFTVVHAVTLEQAREFLRLARFDCILLDLQLPETSDALAIREMRAAASDTPIVAYSSIDDDPMRLAARMEGAQDLLSKSARDTDIVDRAIQFAVEHWRIGRMRQHFELLFAAHPEPMIIFDQGGSPLTANSAAGALLASDDTSLVRRLGAQSHTDGSARELRFSHRGTKRLGEVRSFACSWDGVPTVLHVIRDVTDAAEQAARQRRLQALDAIGHVAGRAARDMEAVLNSADMFIDLLKQSPRLDVEQRGHLEGLTRVLQSGRQIIERLTALEPDVAGMPARIDLARVVQELQPHLQATLGPDIRLVIERDPHLWPVVMDRGAFERTMIALALNAREAMPKGGALNIACSNVKGGAHALDMVSVRVTDTGPGVPMAHAEQIFDVFFTTKSEGAGLGLAICRTAIEHAGGDLRLDTAYRRGASFLITLPRGDHSAALAS